jgi:hypothetical protein
MVTAPLLTVGVASRFTREFSRFTTRRSGATYFIN